MDDVERYQKMKPKTKARDADSELWNVQQMRGELQRRLSLGTGAPRELRPTGEGLEEQNKKRGRKKASKNKRKQEKKKTRRKRKKNRVKRMGFNSMRERERGSGKKSSQEQ